MRIILLNPPGERIYVRNYYCGSTSKASYIFQPIDLLMLSGWLAEDHEIKVIDCIADRLTPGQAIEKIVLFRADAVVCMVSIVSWNFDADFLKKLKETTPSLKIIANGDVFFDEAEKTMHNHPWLDAVIFDFISDNLGCYLRGEEDKITNMMYRKGDAVVFRRIPVQERIFTVPIPRHELFINKNYRFPFARHYPFTTVIVTFGCPFRCSFCIANALGFRYRRAAEVMEELRYIAGLNVREIFFEDMSFGVPRDNIVQLCNAMIAEKLNFSWTCFSRVDLVDKELLLLMKQAGCTTIMFGVESARDDILKANKKDLDKSQVINLFKMCRDTGIKTVATFILGFPQDDEQSCLDTINFAKEIDCDYASFNIAVPRPGTALRQAAVADNIIRQDDFVFDHSGATTYSLSRNLSAEKLAQLKRKAVREFYLRPSYILRQLMQIRSFDELKEHWREFFGLIGQNRA